MQQGRLSVHQAHGADSVPVAAGEPGSLRWRTWNVLVLGPRQDHEGKNMLILFTADFRAPGKYVLARGRCFISICWKTK